MRTLTLSPRPLRRRALGALVASAALAPLAGVVVPAAAPRATAAANLVLAPPGAQSVGYATPQVLAFAGSDPQFVNADPLNQHDVRSALEGRNGKPLFRTTLLRGGETAPVRGVAALGPGAYEFYCSLHGNMQGTLTVVGGHGGPTPGDEPGGDDDPTIRYDDPLPIPKVLTGDDITIRVRQTDVPVLDGPKTRMYTYDGTFPGPTIRRPAGRRTRVTFVNELPRSAGPITVHRHGGHNTSKDDGQPDAELTEPGRRRTYTYDLREDGAPERAAFEWYHDHRLDVTGPQVWKGLAGMYIVDDAVEAALPLPTGAYDVPVMLADRTFDQNNQLADLFAGKTPPGDEVVGDMVLANGKLRPYLEVEPRRYRVRVLNAANFALYNLRLTNGAPLVQIGTDSGLLPAPVTRPTILLGPAERAEVVLDFTGMAGRRVALESVARGDGGGPLGLGAGSKQAPLLQFRVTKPLRGTDTSRVPKTLRPTPDLDVPPTPTPGRHWVAGLGFDPKRGGTAWTFNGRTYDGDVADARPTVGSTESWVLTNPTTVSHMIHIHGTDWRVVSRNGRPPAAWEAGVKDTFLLDPGETVVVAGKLTDHLGRFLVHCHMLEHEDHGMMGQYEVVPPDTAAARTPGRAPLTGQPLTCYLPAGDGGVHRTDRRVRRI